jgi:eukaryotic-like serine/threonine-protein kinase
MYLVSADGGGLEEVMPGEGNVGWSADGNSLIYSDTAAFWENKPSSTLAIRLRDLRTHQVSTLPDSQGLYSPRWSPDGRYIAALRAGPETLAIFDCAAKEWAQLGKIEVGYQSWSRDSKYIYFDSLESEPGFYRVQISDHKAERLVAVKNLRRARPWTGLAPDDSPLLLRDIGSQEIYTLNVEFR